MRRIVVITVVLLLLVLGAICLFRQEPAQTPERFPSILASPLSACQTLPSSQSADVRLIANQLCSTNVEERIAALLACPHSNVVYLLPILSDIMATTDCVQRENRRFFLSTTAGEVMANSETNAIPFIIKSLKSIAPLEIRAGLQCTRDVIMIMKEEGKGKELTAFGIILLPYINSHIASPYTTESALKTLAMLQPYLPSKSSMPTP
jgi:hypothetical protein